jgi:hypothetical protein
MDPKEDHMSRFGLVMLVGLTVATACIADSHPAANKTAKQESPLAPAPVVTTARETSSVCRSYRSNLVLVQERLKNVLADTVARANAQALQEMIADVCN